MMCFEWHELLTTLGLLLDIAGVTVLFVFGLPHNILKGNVSSVPFHLEGRDPTDDQRELARVIRQREADQRRTVAIGHWGGLAALATGFSLQIVAVWMA